MENIGAVILAAGSSTRLGQPKQLLPFRGQSLLRRMVEAATTAGCSPMVIVIGAERERIAPELRETRALLIKNPNWENGIGTSIRVGIREMLVIEPELDAVVLLVCDQPFVVAGTITGLKAKRAATNRPIVASCYARTLGVPALFDRTYFDQLLALEDANGAKSVILANRDQVIEYSFAGGAIDIDTATDYERLLESGGFSDPKP